MSTSEAQKDSATEPRFSIPVDSEHKSRNFNILKFSHPHYTAFHLSWTSFFVCFISTFSYAAFMQTIREEMGCVNKFVSVKNANGTMEMVEWHRGLKCPNWILNKADIADAGILAVTSTTIFRFPIGFICDQYGPKVGQVLSLSVSAISIFLSAAMTGATTLKVCRFFTGVGLAIFVVNQYWMSNMFSPKVVGVANATSAGWGNAGGGITQILMPLVFDGISKHIGPAKAWRVAFVIPGSFHIVAIVMTLLFGRDNPDGDHRALQRKGVQVQDTFRTLFKVASRNYRTWVVAMLYGASFGIELTVLNYIHTYFHDVFDINKITAGYYGSTFGLMNVFARAFGGMGSDYASKKFGMKGRLWVWFILLLGEGAFCIALGKSDHSLGATITFCVLFSCCVQAANGACYGIVPFISKRSLGVVSGFVGAGGSAGSIITQLAFFRPDNITPQEAFVYMGIYVLCLSLLVPTLYFPPWGGMFRGPRYGATEEEYYLSEYSAQEIAEGRADAARKFAENSVSERGSKAALKALTSVATDNEADGPTPPAATTQLATHPRTGI
eukprot:jgi/Mesvir1/29601/Mv21457-RA.1